MKQEEHGYVAMEFSFSDGCTYMVDREGGRFVVYLPVKELEALNDQVGHLFAEETSPSCS